MTTETETTNRLPPAGYLLTSAPADPYVGAFASLLLFLVARFGGLPDDLDAETVRLAVESVAGGGTVLFGLIVALWRRRVRRGNKIR